MEDNILAQLAEILDTDPENLDLSTQLSSFEAWDSIAILGVISLAENLGNNSLEPDDFSEAVTVADVIKLIQ